MGRRISTCASNRRTPDVRRCRICFPCYRPSCGSPHRRVVVQAQPAFEEAIALSATAVAGHSASEPYSAIPPAVIWAGVFRLSDSLRPIRCKRAATDDYIVVVTASAEPRVDDAARLLHYFDPLATKYGMEFAEKGAHRSGVTCPALDVLTNPTSAASTESLTKATETRLPAVRRARGRCPARRLHSHAVFRRAIAGFEKEPEAMRLAFPEMVKRLNSRRKSSAGRS